jgi:hypothetical protein
MNSIRRVLDVRIVDLDLEGLSKSLLSPGAGRPNVPIEDRHKLALSGTIHVQLGMYEPISYHFRGYPLPTSACGRVCLLPAEENDSQGPVKIVGPANITIISPVDVEGYKCIARGIH